MTSASRETIMASLPRTDRARPAVWEPDPVASTLEHFCEQFRALGGRIVTMDEAQALSGECIVDEDAIPIWGEPTCVDVWEAAVGVTLAQCAVAETGSLLLSASSQHRRLGSLAPPRHIILLRETQIVGSLEAGLGQLRAETSVLITGPSRTADIEGVLVNGVHGPREVWVVLIPPIEPEASSPDVP